MAIFAPAIYKEMFGEHEFDYLGKILIGASFDKAIEVSEDHANQVMRKQDKWVEIIDGKISKLYQFYPPKINYE